jgi:hypothetical protein
MFLRHRRLLLEFEETLLGEWGCVNPADRLTKKMNE